MDYFINQHILSFGCFFHPSLTRRGHHCWYLILRFTTQQCFSFQNVVMPNFGMILFMWMYSSLMMMVTNPLLHQHMLKELQQPIGFTIISHVFIFNSAPGVIEPGNITLGVHSSYCQLSQYQNIHGILYPDSEFLTISNSIIAISQQETIPYIQIHT